MKYDEVKFYNDIENKICEMEKDSYEFPKRFSKKDYICIIIVIILCLIFVVAGAFIK